MMQERNRSERGAKEGIVVSDRMDKTVVVAVQRLVRHPLYKRVVRRTRKFKVHDPNNDCRAGDRVRIVASRPYSREKKWRVAEIVRRAK